MIPRDARRPILRAVAFLSVPVIVLMVFGLAATWRQLRPPSVPVSVDFPADGPMRIGVNLDSVVDWETAWTFTDLFKHSRPWIVGGTDLDTGERRFDLGPIGGTIPLTPDGWPAELKLVSDREGRRWHQAAVTLVMRENRGSYPGGVYRAEWVGRGRVDFDGTGVAVRERTTRDDGRHVAYVDYPPDSDDGMTIRVTETDPRDPVRDLRLWMPRTTGHEFVDRPWRPGDDFSPFHPLFVERLRGFDTIRFMDWSDTNRSSEVKWRDRRQVTDARQRPLHGGAGEIGDRRGVAREYHVALCNELRANLWVCLPHAADDDYVEQYARLVRDTLDPSLRVYVEWSNEVWNRDEDFHAHRWVGERLAESGLNERDRWRLVAGEIRRDFAIWRRVFDETEQGRRVTRVVSGQLADPGKLEAVLRHMGGEFDAVAVAAYFAPSDDARRSWSPRTTPEEVLQPVIERLDTIRPFFDRHKAIADAYAERLGRSIPLLAYEGGQDIGARGDRTASYLGALANVQRHPMMAEAYRRHLRNWRESGGELFVHFAHVSRHGPFGQFGSLDRQDRPTGEAPKYRALRDAIDGTLFEPGRSHDPPTGPADIR